MTTLAGDVRVLRAQIKAKGGTPEVPDPSRAVEGLPDRAEVPVPIQGPSGPLGKTGPVGRAGDTGDAGDPGANGNDGQSGNDGNDGTPGSQGGDGNNGADGSAGAPGPEGPAGPQGEQGPTGDRGEQGDRGAAGPNCPNGYSLQAPLLDPDGLMCRRSGGAGGTPEQGLLGLSALSMSAYRRL